MYFTAVKLKLIDLVVMLPESMLGRFQYFN